MTVDLEAMYRAAPINLWVEDPETRSWLNAIWLGMAPTIAVRTAGGHPNVTAMCSQAVEYGTPNVFGLLDMDFGSTNRLRWQDFAPHERIYRMPVHEIENYFLHSRAMENCRLNTNPRRTEAQIESRLVQAAGERLWHYAAARVLAAVRDDAFTGFPQDPGILTSKAAALQYLQNSPWFSSKAAAIPSLINSERVESALVRHHDEASHLLAARAPNTWPGALPGKEVFRAVSGFVQQSGGTTARLDLVKAIAEQQRALGLVPPDVTELRRLLVARVPGAAVVPAAAAAGP